MKQQWYRRVRGEQEGPTQTNGAQFDSIVDRQGRRPLLSCMDTIRRDTIPNRMEKWIFRIGQVAQSDSTGTLATSANTITVCQCIWEKTQQK